MDEDSTISAYPFSIFDKPSGLELSFSKEFAEIRWEDLKWQSIPATLFGFQYTLLWWALH